MRLTIATLVLLTLLPAPAQAARLFTSGFIGDFSAAGKTEWFTLTGTPIRESTIKPTCSKYSLEASGLTSGVAKGMGLRYVSTASDGVDYFHKFDFYVVTRPSASNTVWSMGVNAVSSDEINIRLKTSGELEIYDDNSLLQTSAVLSLNTWYRIEVRIRRDMSAPGTGFDHVQARIDGSDFYSTEMATITIGPREIMLGGNMRTEAQTQGEWYFANAAVNDSTGGSQTSWPGAGCVTYLTPDGVGTYSEPVENTGTTDWEVIDEDTPDFTTTYTNFQSTNSTDWSTGANRLLVTCTSSSASGIGAADTITLTAVGAVTSVASGTAGGAVGLKTSGSPVDALTQRTHTVTANDVLFSGSTGLNRYEHLYTDPTDSGAWTTGKLDEIEIGYRAHDVIGNVRLTAMWLMVEFVDNAETGSSPKGTLLGVLP